MKLIVTLKNFTSTPAVLDSNCNFLVYYTFTIFNILIYMFNA